MLRVLSFVVLFSACLSSDDHSLMQQGSIALQRATAAEVQGAMRNLADKMNEIPNPGKVRQMAIDALMKEVSTKTEIDQDAKDILGQVVQLLDDILKQLRDSNTEDQNELNEIINAIPNCNSNDVDIDGQAEDAMTLAQGTHKDCRFVQEAIFNNKTLSCQDLTVWMNTVLDGFAECEDLKSKLNAPANSEYHDIAQMWANWFLDAKTTFTDLVINFNTYAPPCQGDIDSLSQQAEQCEQDQVAFENKYCLWRLTRLNRCSTLQTCSSEAIATHEGHVARIKPLADQRVREARLIKYISCLVSNLINGETNTQPCKDELDLPATETEIQTNYNVSYPAIPDVDSCDTNEVNTSYPGTGDWFGSSEAGYVNWSPGHSEDGGRANDNTGVKCLNVDPGHNL